MSDDGLAPIAAWPGDHRAAGWRHGDGRTGTAGEVTHPFALASVTKVLSALAVLVATQEDIVDLDEPMRDAGGRPLLVRHVGSPVRWRYSTTGVTGK